MKSVRATVLIAALAAFSPAQDAPRGGTVQGTVLNSVTGAGISGAWVVLSANTSTRYETTSDASGHFKITGMSLGTYRARVEKDGFAPPATDLAFFLNAGLLVASGTDPVKVELKLTPLNTILGRILGADGKPAAGVEVSLSPNITANRVVTGPDGSFALDEIRPGSYTLIARPPAIALPEEPPEKATDGTRIAIVTTYYPSVADQSLAEQIVSPGVGSYEIRMQTAPVHRVGGIVLDQEGNPVPGAELTLFPIAEGISGARGLSIGAGGLSLFALGMRSGPRVPEATAIAGKDGRFEFPAVRSGEWRINTVSYAPPDAPAAPSRGTIGALVGRADVDDLQIHVAKSFKLTGTSEWKDDPGSLSAHTRFLSGGVILVNPDDTESLHFGRVESGGLVFADILPGRYRLIVRPGMAAQTFLGDNEVTGTFPLTADGPRLHLVLKTWSGTVRGTVEKGAGATVVLVPQRVEGVALGQTAVCGAGGSFELSEVSPGDYYIAAFDHMDGVIPSPAMLSMVPSRGTSVKVEERSAANVTLSVIAGPQ
jgi:hypothetical protein